MRHSGLTRMSLRALAVVRLDDLVALGVDGGLLVGLDLGRHRVAEWVAAALAVRGVLLELALGGFEALGLAAAGFVGRFERRVLGVVEVAPADRAGLRRGGGLLLGDERVVVGRGLRDGVVGRLRALGLAALLAARRRDARPRCLDRRCRADGYRLSPVAVAITLAYAATDEWHQTFVHGRHGSPWDWAIDAAGVGLAGLLVWRLAYSQPRSVA